jgi:hypothetical protein
MAGTGRLLHTSGSVENSPDDRASCARLTSGALRLPIGAACKRFSRDPYLQLERYYKDIGDEAAARMAHLKGHRAFRESAKSSESPAGWNRRQSAWDLFLNLSIGYGLQAWRLLVPLLFVFILGAAVFSDPGALVYKANGSPMNDYASWWPGLVYSFDLLIPVLTFPPADQWAPNGDGREIFAVVEVVIGWLLVPLMIAAWTGIVTKN